MEVLKTGCTGIPQNPPHSSQMIDVFQDTIEITGTFKHRKVTLVEEGFNPAVIKDALYFLDDKAEIKRQVRADFFCY